MTKSGYGKQNGGRKRVLRRSGVPPEIHCMMIPAQDATLLLPTSVMAEVMDYVEPQPIEDSPPWLFGQVEWEGRQVPVFDFSALINGADPQSPSSRARIMVLKSLSDSNRMLPVDAVLPPALLGFGPHFMQHLDSGIHFSHNPPHPVSLLL